MLVLALDTTSRQGSVALVRDGALLGTETGDATVTHGERLPGDLIRLLEKHQLTMKDVELFAVAAGPGSFTGLRIGIATLQGLAVGYRRPLVGVSALDALDDAARSLAPSMPQTASARQIAVWMDALRGQVFSAVYDNGRRIDDAIAEKPAAVLDRWGSAIHPDCFAGDGAIVYRDAIQERYPDAVVLDIVPLLAPSVAKLAEAYTREHGPAQPDAIRPIYVRRPDVELARDRAARDAATTAAPAGGLRRS